MRLLIDLCHPAHVHLFKHAIREWQANGVHVVIVAREKDVTTQLLDAYRLSYHKASKKRCGHIGQAVELLERDVQIYRLARREICEILMGTSVSVSHAAKLLGARSVVFNEDDRAVTPLFAFLAYPLADRILTPDCLREDHGPKHVKYRSYHELAYLHPDRFSPNREDLGRIGLAGDEPYFIVRLVALQATHDAGAAGIRSRALSELIAQLSERGRVLISSERSLPRQFEPYRAEIPPEDMHLAMSFASLFVGDSQTMAVESAVLGVPALRLNSFVGRISVLQELEHVYGLTYGFRPGEEHQLMEKAVELLDDPNLHEVWARRRDRMLEEKIDFTTWMLDFVQQLSEGL